MSRDGRQRGHKLSEYVKKKPKKRKKSEWDRFSLKKERSRDANSGY